MSKPAPSTTYDLQDRPLVGILLLITAMCVVPLMDGVAKHLSQSYPVMEVVWARYFFHFLFMLPVVFWRYGRRALYLDNPWSQVLRGAFLLASTILFFAAIASMPLADALALVFISPLVVTALSPFLLKEQVGVRRWAAVGVGFVGALIITRPGLGVMSFASLMAMGAGVCYAFYMLATRRLAGSAPPMVTLTYTAALGAVALTLALPFFWQTPALADLPFFVALGLIAAVGHYLVIKACDYAAASVLAPYTYSEIVMTTLIGYVVFGDFPDSMTWLGVAVIIASGVYISWRERVRSGK
ncbi:DMT family transporter [Rhodovibrionaceae bacterium A322]